ncbi:MAG TPA: C69 family dipeptidase [Candidatus Binatia bacterium]|nr:C69 family dipeptidase [Candidatus Binatia bacterium]
MCDTLVALPQATRDGVALFAKNSDRPARECQRIVQLPHRRHPPGARVRCQYVEVPQVPETAAVLGSQPHWLWGLEHGVNEHRVAIGNETVFAREPLGDTGLLGMDLVRLGLERARTAAEALEVMTALLEAHGQGGSGQLHLHWPYHNGFLIADPTSAWILETSGRHWAARPVDGVGNVSNGLAIGADWTRGSADLTTFAVAQGWWPPAAGRVDFAAAYADESGVPPHQCAPRRRRAATLLAEGAGGLGPASLRAILRDHYDAGPVHRPRAFDDPCFFSLCMHADPLDNTTAAMVARLPADPTALAVAWVCLGSPCTGAFLPLYPAGTIPPRLALGGGAPEPASPWWRMRALLELVERDFARWGTVVRARWDEFEAALEREAAAEEAAALACPAEGPARLTAFMERTVDAWLACAEAVCHELARYS